MTLLYAEEIVNGYRVVTTWHPTRAYAQERLERAMREGAEDARVLRGSALGAFRVVSWTVVR